jgi:hypothetical protein
MSESVASTSETMSVDPRQDERQNEHDFSTPCAMQRSFKLFDSFIEHMAHKFDMYDYLTLEEDMDLEDLHMLTHRHIFVEQQYETLKNVLRDNAVKRSHSFDSFCDFVFRIPDEGGIKYASIFKKDTSSVDLKRLVFTELFLSNIRYGDEQRTVERFVENLVLSNVSNYACVKGYNEMKCIFSRLYNEGKLQHLYS